MRKIRIPCVSIHWVTSTYLHTRGNVLCIANTHAGIAKYNIRNNAYACAVFRKAVNTRNTHTCTIATWNYQYINFCGETPVYIYMEANSFTAIECLSATFLQLIGLYQLLITLNAWASLMLRSHNYFTAMTFIYYANPLHPQKPKK